MILTALAVLAALWQPDQILAGPDFDRFAQATDRSCPQRRLRFITPGDLSWEDEAFAARLDRAARARLTTADRGDTRCTGDGGLSCPTVHTLAALRRTGLLPAFSRFACAHPAPAGSSEAGAIPARAMLAARIIEHLDLASFPNSTVPRRRPPLHTPRDYGFTVLATFPDGWAQLSEPVDRRHLSALVLDGSATIATICFTDAGGVGATYRATQVLRATRGDDSRWRAIQTADRADCRNVPAR